MPPGRAAKYAGTTRRLPGKLSKYYDGKSASCYIFGDDRKKIDFPPGLWYANLVEQAACIAAGIGWIVTGKAG